MNRRDVTDRTDGQDGDGMRDTASARRARVLRLVMKHRPTDVGRCHECGQGWLASGPTCDEGQIAERIRDLREQLEHAHSDIDAYWGRIHQLEDAIHRHREAVRAGGPAEHRLWALLEHAEIPAPEVDVCPKCGTEGAQCCI